MDPFEESLPEWEHEMSDAVVIAADRPTAFDAMVGLRAGDSKLAVALGTIRSGRRVDEPKRRVIDEMADAGWVELSRVRDVELAAGLVGKVWRPDFGVRHVADRDAFVAFDGPGYAKIAFRWRLEDLDGGATRLRAVTRVHTTSNAAARLFRVYWSAVGLGARLTVRSGLQAIRRRAEQRSGAADAARGWARPWLEGVEAIALLGTIVPTWPLARRWLDDVGSTADERRRRWPGDRFLERIDEAHTRALSIDAPAERVWPWLTQWGLGRGGFHSYELLENLAGLGVTNADRPLPTSKPLTAGDRVWLAADAPLWVAEITPERSLCFRTWKDEAELSEEDPETVGTFSLYLEPTSSTSCRFVLRTCKQHRRPPRPTTRWLGSLFEAPLDWVMEQRMMRTVRRLSGETRLAGVR
jgi:hypothetical protein